MDIVFDQNGIRILFRPVGSSTTVVTFAAFGVPPDPVPRSEFHKVLHALNDDRDAPGTVNIITVIDSQRRYYLDGNTATIIKEVNGLLKKSKTKRTITLGLSMGAFAAIALARKLHRCRSVIAFGARSAVHPSVVPVDQRVLEFRSKIRRWDIMDCLEELNDRIHYNLFYGQKDLMDMHHADRFFSINHPNMRIEVIPNCDHNVVDHWIREGILKDRLSRLIFTAQKQGAFDVAFLWARRVAQLPFQRFGGAKSQTSGAPRPARSPGPPRSNEMHPAPLPDIA